MKILPSLLLASATQASTITDDLIIATCDSDGFHLTIDENVRKGIYYFIQWPSTFLDGQYGVYEMPNPRPQPACRADGTGANWVFNTRFDECNIQSPGVYTDPATNIEYFVYTMYLNYDNGIDSSIGTGNLQQLERTKIECKISRKFQENATVGDVNMKKAEIIDDIKMKKDLWGELQLDVYNGGFQVPPQWSSNPLTSRDTVKIGEHIKLKINNSPGHYILDKWNVAIEDCWASTVENRAAGEVDTGVIHFDVTGMDGVPGENPLVKHETVKFWDRQCPNFNWVVPLFKKDAKKNTEIALKQFAFNDNVGGFNQDFFYHCIVVLCEHGTDCVHKCNDPPIPPNNAPAGLQSNGRRRRAIVSSRRMEQDFLTTVDFSRNEVERSGELNSSPNLKLENACEHGIKQEGAAFVCAESSAAKTFGIAFIFAFITALL